MVWAVIERADGSGVNWIYKGPSTPRPSVSRSVTPAKTLNQQSSIREIQKNVTGRNKPLPIVYGAAQVGGMLCVLSNDDSSGDFTVAYALCLGEIESIDEVYLDGELPPVGVTIAKYTGTQAQTADSMLSAAIDGYDDDLVGVAYLVIQYPSGTFNTWPEVVANVKGRKVYNPANTNTEFSENPVLHNADFIVSTDYGIGRTVNWASVISAAAYADDASLGEARRKSFMVIDTPKVVDAWNAIMQAYTGCFQVYEGEDVYFIPDQAGTSSATFTDANIVKGSMRISKKDGRNLPTVVVVEYTDDSTSQWSSQRSDEAARAGVGTTLNRRVSVVSMPGIKRHSQAYREAVERLNKITLSDLAISFETFSEGLEVTFGDIITVSHVYGLTSKEFRVTEFPELMEHGRWRIQAEEYDSAAYSNAVIERSSTPDTSLPVNQPPVAASNLTISEVTYQLQNGKYASRLNISWNASPSLYVLGYTVRVYDGVEVVWASTIDSLNVSTSPLKELIEYNIEVRPYTSLFVGSAVNDTYSIIGKTAIPDAPASMSAFEVGGEVRLSWAKSTDVDAERYEIRYSTIGGGWDSATELDITDGLRLSTKDVPEGDWEFYVKTIDSIGQFSTGLASTTATVTLDNDAFTAASQVPLIPDTVTNMLGTQEDRTSPIRTYYATSAESWTSLFGASAMNSFDELYKELTLSGNSIFNSAEIDLIEDKSANFRGDLPIFDSVGSVSVRLQLKLDGGSFVDETQVSVQGTARYARMRAFDDEPFVIKESTGFVRADVVAVEEVGFDTSNSGSGKKILLSKQFAAARSIFLVPEGNTPLIAVYDNIVLNDSGNGNVTTFDVYVFDNNGNQVAADFRWQWKGV